MKLGIFGDEHSWHSQDLVRAAGSGHELRFFEIGNLSAELCSESSETVCNGFRLGTLDAAFVRTIPAGSLEQIVFRMDTLAELARCGVAVVNPARAIEACVDKYLALCLARRTGVPIPRTAVCQNTTTAQRLFESFGNRAILKPVFGSEGRGLVLLDNLDLALRAFHLLENAGQTIYLQEVIDHGNQDIRIFVAGQEMVAMRRSNPADWRVNAGRGARTFPHQLTEQEREIARLACASVGAVVAGIDLVHDTDGNPYVLEINSAPGWKKLSETVPDDVASMVLKAIEVQAGQTTSGNAVP